MKNPKLHIQQVSGGQDGSLPLVDLSVSHLKVEMPDFVLLADFKVHVGERVALVGKSGSGKTTLLRALAGLERIAPGGQILLGSEEISKFTPQQRKVGFVFQDQALFESMNVLDNATFALRMQGQARSTRDALALDWLKKVGLHARAYSSIGTLSGGEKQRVAFIRALIGRPRLILLDEPFSSLDAELREGLRSEFLLLHSLWPAPVLLVTHDEGDIRSLATASLRLEWDSSSPVRKISRQLTNA